MIFRKNQDINNLTFEYEISNDDNIIGIRERIAKALWNNNQHIDERTIIFTFNHVILDVNRKLLELVHDQNVTIDCIIEPTVNLPYLFNLNINNENRFYGLIEIERQNSIADLMQYLSMLLNNPVVAILKDHKKIDGALCSCNIMDYDRIIAVIKDEGFLCVYPILQTGENVRIPYRNYELVNDFKARVALELKYNIDDYILFYGDHWLEEDKFIYEYLIENDSFIKYCFFDKIDTVDRISQMDVCGSFSVLYVGRILSTNQEITIKKYNCNGISHSVESYKPMIRELVSFTRIRDERPLSGLDNSRIVQLVAFFRDETAFYVGMEYMRGGSIHAHVGVHYPLSENLIAKWLRQILEGVAYLHDLQIIHRDLRTSNVLLDDNLNVKISGFSLSKYLMGDTASVLSQGFVQSKAGTFNFMAPEVFCMEDSGSKADIWSVGAILVELVTGLIPLHHLNEIDAGLEIARTGTIEFQEPPHGMSNALRAIIGQCLRFDPRQRPRARQLLDDEFLRVNRECLL